MDPISASASVITLLGAAGGTLKGVYNVIRDLSEAPSDIRKNSKKMNALCKTISCLVEIYQKLPATNSSGLDLPGIEDFIQELEDFRQKLQNKTMRLDWGHAHRLRESTKWLISDRQVQKLFNSLDEWNIVLTQALWVAQLSIMQRIMEQTSRITTGEGDSREHEYHNTTATDFSVMRPPTGVNMNRLDVDCDTQVGSSRKNSNQQFTRFLASTEDIVGMLCSRRYWSAIGPFQLSMQRGKSIVRRWVQEEGKTYSTASYEGLTMTVTFQTRHWFAITLLFRLHTPYDYINPISLSLQSKLRFRRIFPDSHPFFEAVRSGDIDYLRHQLSMKQFDIQDIGPNGWNSLHLAAWYGQVNVIATLLDAGAEVDVADNQGCTPLHVACVSRSSARGECARLLLCKGADICRQTIDGHTPLHCSTYPLTQAIIHSHAEDIDPWLQDRWGRAIIQYIGGIKHSSSGDIDKLLRLHQPQLLTSHLKSTESSLLKNTDLYGWTVLHSTIASGNFPLTQWLLSHPSMATLPKSTVSGESLLHIAATSEHSNEKIIDFLLFRMGLDINAKDKCHKTVMHCAADYGNIDGIKHLLLRGAGHQIYERDKDGLTPRQYARRNHLIEAHNFLAALEKDYEGASKVEAKMSSTIVTSENSSEPVQGRIRRRLSSLSLTPSSLLKYFILLIAVIFISLHFKSSIPGSLSAGGQMQ